MAVAAVVTSVNIITSSATRKLTHSSSTTHFPPSLHVSNTRAKKSFPFLIHCSTTPDIDSNNATSNNPIVENGSNSKIPEVTTTLSSSDNKSSFSSSIGLVLDLGLKGTWDSHEIGSPVVKRFISDDEERWYMWYYGNSDGGSDLIGLAVSSNGVHWEKGSGPVRSNADVGLVMNCSKDWWAFDTQGIRPSEVVIMSSSKVRASSAVYWLYYTGFNTEKVEFLVTSKVPVQNPEMVLDDKNQALDICRSLPGLAISQDGRHWARIEGEHHSGALLDVGAETEWDSLFIAEPHVVFHSSGDLRMYYHSFDAKCGQFAVGLARSRDGIKWVKLGKIIGGGSASSFDEFGVMNAHVIKSQKDGQYVMAYEGVAADGSRSIGLAVSRDGLKEWRKCGDGAVLKPSVEEDGWDNKYVGSPCLVEMDGKDNEWRLYYRGIGKEGKTGIGLAVSEEAEIKSFRRLTGFHL
ncbi:Glycosyl hydrolase, five-bladed beta-propellor domain containing protein [Thalictrum thalictroides]|uniref:Glycosyl hydrolase, five-bladed beta-propellor domain containing protein n=1 Tax=Thalictrum thalictroides TaxID=46969 RepID=A0A7J6WLT4_THATH|nr:Glycosyl hydrolase, five-bladed beta-propellor domain containing protein [Thalictrum thalictroides]